MDIKLKGYKITSELYKGKRSKIFRGQRIYDGFPVIIKTKNKEYQNNEEMKELRWEFEVGSTIRANNVIQYLDLVKYNSGLAIIEEYFNGESIRELNKSKLFTLEEFLSIAIQICSALKRVHSRNIVHGSINPTNILYDKKNDRIKIIDFSCAEYLSNEDYIMHTNGVLADSLNYISPEQTGRMNRAIDYRSDFYSLGITFYEMLTGKLPFKADDTMELIYSHVTKQPESITKFDISIPKVVSDIILKLIAKNPEDRYKSASGLKKDLEQCLIKIKNNEIVDFELGKCDFSGEFYIPKKLYGREKDVENITKSFERVTEGEVELFLISGAPGVGKSSLVKELYNIVHKKNGYYIEGKFEQFQNDIPYKALIEALNNFINQLLMEPSDKLTIWKEVILNAVGSNGQAIVDVIPNLELIIGRQPSIPKLGPSETQNRLDLIFKNFINVIATKEHPLAIFIDDLQWADSGSLSYIRKVLKDRTNKYLLIIGAYRDNDADLIYPIDLLKNELVEDRIIINTINLKALPKKDVQMIVQDALVRVNRDSAGIEELADCICCKTHGNPFFVKQFFRSLYDFGHLWFEYKSMKWCFNIEEIKRMNVTENVLDLLDNKIKKLSSSTIQYLKYGACIGNNFDLETLTCIENSDCKLILLSLQPAIELGLIYDQNSNDTIGSIKENIKFKFVHDRVQQVVYEIIEREEKCAIHLKLGYFYLKRYEESNNSEDFFETVRQLNAGCEIVTDEAEMVKLAELNLKAGLMAKKASAYYSSYIYFNEGIKLLCNVNGWEDYYNLNLQLYSEISEASYLISDYRKMDRFIVIVLNNARTLLDKINVYRIKIEAAQAQLKARDALDTALSILRLMSVDIPYNPRKQDVDEIFENTWSTVLNIKVENIVNLPTMKDPVMLGAMQILMGSISAAYKVAPMIMNIAVCKMVDISIKFGNSPFAPGAYSLYGLALCSHITNIELGNKLEEYVEIAYKIGKINMIIAEDENMKPSKAIVLDVNNSSINEWKESLRKTLKPLMDGYFAGIENGNFEYAGYCLMNYNKHSFYSGIQLEVIEKEIETNLVRLQKIKQCFSINWVNIWGQLIQNLQGKSKDPVKLEGDFCNEEEMTLILERIGDMLGLVFLYISKMILNYYFGNYFIAVQCGKKVEENLAGASATMDISMYYFYDSLSRLGAYSDLTKDEQNQTLLRINNNQAIMKTWSKLAPMNYLHKFYLVHAELCKVTGNFSEAQEYYNKSIELAKENQYLNDEALAYELAGKFYLDMCKSNTARIYLNKAQDKYILWGAMRKVNQMKNEYLSLEFDDKNNLNTAENIDLFSIMKASQAISSEINLEGLLNRLINVILENMGAQKGFIILKREEKLIVEAYVDKTRNKREILNMQFLDEFDEIPRTIIRYTARTGEDVVFPAKSDKFIFGKDSYIINKKPKSFLSTAVKLKNEIKGVLYLENNLIEGAFKPDRVKVIQILAAQAAISLENAMLYNTLEKNMKDKLRDSENKLQITVRNAGLGLWEWKMDTDKNIINEEWAAILGYTLEELTPTTINSWKNLIHPDDLPKSIECIKRCASKECDVYECEIRMKHKNGKWVWILSKGRVVEWDENDKPVAMSGIHMNINQRKLVEGQLKKAKEAIEEVNVIKNHFLMNLSKDTSTLKDHDDKVDNLVVVTDRAKELEKINLILEEVNASLEDEIEKYNETEAELRKAKIEAENANIAKSNFIANISHELRTPIAVILSGIQLIEANAKDTFENKQNISKHIKTIKQNCYRLLRLVNNIIDVTKIDAGFKKLNLKNLNIISLIENITISVVEYAELKGLTIIFDTDEEERVVAVDPDKIERIFLNLLSNGIKFTPKNGQIFVKIINKPNDIIISVEDTGIGIPSEKKEEIFEKFQQIDNTFTRKNEGSGIGLSIVKSFVELHGGNITLSSELGKGSRFTIELPAKQLQEDQMQLLQNQVENSSGFVDILNIEFSDIYFD